MAQSTDPTISSSQDTEDDDLDLCDTEALWDKTLRQACNDAESLLYSQDPLQVNEQKDSNNVSDNRNIVENNVRHSSCSNDEGIAIGKSILDFPSEISKENKVYSTSGSDHECNPAKTKNRHKSTEIICISDSSDIESDTPGSVVRSYSPISGGKWQKRSVPRSDAPASDVSKKSDGIFQSYDSCAISKAVECSEDIDNDLEDYVESDNDDDFLVKTKTPSSPDKHKLESSETDPIGIASSDDEAVNTVQTDSSPYIKKFSDFGTSTVSVSSSSDSDISFRDVLMAKRRQSSEKKKSSLLRTETKLLNEDGQEKVFSSLSELDGNKRPAEKFGSNKLDNSDVDEYPLKEDSKYFTKSAVKRSPSIRSNLSSEDAVLASSSKKSKKDIKQEGILGVTSSGEKTNKEQPKIFPKLVMVKVSQEEIDKVIEIFPDANSGDVKSRIQLIKSKSSENILEQVIDNMFSCPYTKEVQSPLTTPEPSTSGGEPDILEALGTNVIRIKPEHDKEYSISVSGSTENRNKSHGKLSKDSVYSRKGKIPMRRNNIDGFKDSEMGEAFRTTSTMEVVHADEIPPAVFECESCKSTVSDDKVVQCGNSHIICNACVEKQVKSVLAPDSKEVLIKCCVDGCVGTVPNSQAKRVLPSLIMDLLEQKLDREALDSIKNMGDSIICPVCELPMTADPWLKEIECPKCKQKSCRFCRRRWFFADHTDCTPTNTPKGQDHQGVLSTLDVPFYWSQMPENQNKDYVTVDVQKDTPEFAHVFALFRKSMSNKRISSIRRIQNLRLWQRFCLTKKHMIEDFGPQNLNEQQLFHGTNYQAVDAICREGLDWRMCGENAGTAFGQGTYFAKQASYSDRYVTKYRPLFYNGSQQQQQQQNTGFTFGVQPVSGFTFGPFSGPTTFQFGVSNVFSQAQSSNPLGFASNQNTGATGSNHGNQQTTHIGVPAVATANQQGGFIGLPAAAVVTGSNQGNQQTFPAAVQTSTSGPATTTSSFSFFGSSPQISGNVFASPFGTSQSSSSQTSQNETDFMQSGMRYLFVARVLVGRSCTGSSRIRKPPKDDNDVKGRPFNSCVDSVENPHIFVIFDSSQCYPEYIVEY